MAFNLTEWAAQVKERLQAWAQTPHAWRDAGAQTLFGFLATMTLFPLAEALGRGDVMSVCTALGAVAGGVGGNLVAGMVQRWSDRVDARSAAGELESALASSQELRQAVDALLSEFDVVRQARQALPKAEQRWLAEQLQNELDAYPNGLERTVSVVGDVYQEITVKGGGVGVIRAQDVTVVQNIYQGQPPASKMHKMSPANLESQESDSDIVSAFSQGTHASALPNGKYISGLLEAAGYCIIDTREAGANLYFWCKSQQGSEVVVHFVSDKPLARDITALNDTVSSSEMKRLGILLTRHSLPKKLYDLALQRSKNIRCYTLEEFIDLLVDPRPYLQRLIQEYETSDLTRLYVPLTVQTETGETKPLEDFIETWLREPERNHLSLIGKYGGGKTWFCRRYSYMAAKRHLSDPSSHRIPILIHLHNYSNSQKAEDIIIDALTNDCQTRLAAGYKTFNWLNQAGRLLLIMDGFDEMQRKAGIPCTVKESFERLSTLVSSQSKILLTCRAEDLLHRGEGEEDIAPKPNELSIVIEDEVIVLRNRQGYEIAYICDFAQKDVQQALRKLLPADWKSIYASLQDPKLDRLTDLPRRPMFLGMVAALPRPEKTGHISLATLYQNYLNRWLMQVDTGTENLSTQERSLLAQELAWAVYTNPSQLRAISLAMVLEAEHVIAYFGLKDNPTQTMFLERDLSTQSYLIHDGRGNYRFAHKSFEEYFAAQKMAIALRDLESNLAKAVEVWKIRRLAPVVQDFLVNMIDEDTLLWRLIEATRGKSEIEVEYAGGNAATVLHAKGYSFDRRDLSGAVLKGATLPGASFCKAGLEDVTISEADLVGADFTRAVIGNVNAANANVRDAVPTDQLGRLIEAGAYMDRYTGDFGRYFASQQAVLLGGNYNVALMQFLSMIREALTDDDLVLDLMSGGGDITESLLGDKPELRIVVTALVTS